MRCTGCDKRGNFAAKLDVLGDSRHGRLRGVSPTSAFQMLKDLGRSALVIQVVCLDNRIQVSRIDGIVTV